MSFDADALRAAVRTHGQVARVVVAEVAGSAPREPGAAMVVHADGQDGTIGGGALEYAAAAAARSALASGAHGARLTRHPLGPGLGQCCGGAVALITEVWDGPALDALAPGPVARRVAGDAAMPLALARALRQARGEGRIPPVMLQGGWLLEPRAAPTQTLWLWGAGHVGRALADVIAPLPDWAITWVDTGPERFPDVVPPRVTPLPAAAPAALVPRAPQDAHHLVLTYSHALDLALCAALLSHGFASAGLIGSRTKWARFRSRLAAAGHAPAAISRIACPIGDPSLGKHPHAIALGVAAALLRGAATDRLPKDARA